MCIQGTCQARILRQIEEGDVSIAAVNAALSSKKCRPMPGMAPTLDKLKTSEEFRASFPSKLAAGFGGKHKVKPMHAYGVWLASTSSWARRCGVETDLRSLSEGAYVSDKDIDAKLKAGHCNTLADIDTLNLWPYQRRFATEVVKNDYSAAEVTRRVWIKVIESVESKCKGKLDLRAQTALEARREKLQGVVGLDDEILIGLRGKLLAAMEGGDAEAARSYTRAITDREKALDARNAGRYEARLHALQDSVSHQATQRKATQGKGGSYRDTLQDVKDTVDTARDAARTTREVMGLFGL